MCVDVMDNYRQRAAFPQRDVMGTPQCDQGPSGRVKRRQLLTPSLDWSTLPAPLLEKILSHFTDPLDTCALACTCKRWYQICSQQETSSLVLRGSSRSQHIGWIQYIRKVKSVDKLQLTIGKPWNETDESVQDTTDNISELLLSVPLCCTQLKLKIDVLGTKVFRSLTRLTNLRELRLHSINSVDADALREGLAVLSQLQTLDLRASWFDERLPNKALSSLPVSLSSLSLQGYNLRDFSLKNLPASLTHLDLSRSSMYLSWTELGHLSQLISLNLKRALVTARGQSFLQPLPSLTSLNCELLDVLWFSQPTTGLWASFPNLTEMNVNRSVMPANLRWFQEPWRMQLPSALRKLTLATERRYELESRVNHAIELFHTLPHSALEYLPNLDEVHVLDTQSCAPGRDFEAVCDWAGGFGSSLKSITFMKLMGQPQRFDRLSSLRSLTKIVCNILCPLHQNAAEPLDLVFTQQLPKLEVLHLLGFVLQSVDLASCTALQDLKLARCLPTQVQPLKLLQLPSSLHRLSLVNILSDDVRQSLVELPKLERLCVTVDELTAVPALPPTATKLILLGKLDQLTDCTQLSVATQLKELVLQQPATAVLTDALGKHCSHKRILYVPDKRVGFRDGIFKYEEVP